MVQQAREDEKVYIRVYSSSSRRALSRGIVDGVWPVGSLKGTCCGSLAWLTDECHVVKMLGGESLDGMRERAVPTAEAAPWARCVAGSPKKSKRGAHLKKGGSAYVARMGGETGQASQSSAQRQ